MRSLTLKLGAPVAAACITATSGCVSVTTPAYPEVSTQEGPRPNILVMLVDDQPLGMMDAIPFTKRWMRDSGVRYSNAVSTTPLCTPARASVLTGQYAHNHGVHRLDAGGKLPVGDIFPARLRASGYRTAMSGKFVNGWKDAAPAGFDRYARTAQATVNTRVWADADTADALRIDEASTSPRQIDTITEAASAWLDDFESDDEKPWLMYLAPSAPHGPYSLLEGPKPDQVPRHVSNGTQDVATAVTHIRDTDRRTHRESGFAKKKWTRSYRSLRQVDTLSRAVHARLTELGELDNTIVVFASDNGVMFGSHQTKRKREAYDESVRVPMYVSWPDHLQPGTVDDRIAGLIDIAPTLYDAAGVRSAPRVDGRSLLTEKRRSRILIEHVTGGPKSSGTPTWRGWWSGRGMYRQAFYEGRTKRWRQAVGSEELYVDDRLQRHNLIASGTRARAARTWARKAFHCQGGGCRTLEDASFTHPKSMAVKVRAALEPSTGVASVVVTNRSGKALRNVTVASADRATLRIRAAEPRRRLKPGRRAIIPARVSLPDRRAPVRTVQVTYRVNGRTRTSWTGLALR